MTTYAMPTTISPKSAPGDRYRETLFQKVAAGYLQAFVQANFPQQSF